MKKNFLLSSNGNIHYQNMEIDAGCSRSKNNNPISWFFENKVKYMVAQRCVCWKFFWLFKLKELTKRSRSILAVNEGRKADSRTSLSKISGARMQGEGPVSKMLEPECKSGNIDSSTHTSTNIKLCTPNSVGDLKAPVKFGMVIQEFQNHSGFERE